jgi:hypothetical protein
MLTIIRAAAAQPGSGKFSGERSGMNGGKNEDDAGFTSRPSATVAGEIRAQFRLDYSTNHAE